MNGGGGLRGSGGRDVVLLVVVVVVVVAVVVTVVGLMGDVVWNIVAWPSSRIQGGGRRWRGRG